MKAEVGVVVVHPIVYAWRHIKTVWRTWRFAKSQGLSCNRWYGVYIAGTEIVLAQVGCLPGAEDRAKAIAESLNS